MYCKKCGCKLVTGKNICPECGSDSTNIEYCGGFWGLVGEPQTKAAEQPFTDNRVVDERIVSRVEEEDSDSNGNQNNLIKWVLIFILLVLCAVQTFRVSSVSDKYKESVKTVNELNAKYEKQEQQYNKIKEQYKAITGTEWNEKASDKTNDKTDSKGK